MRDDGMTMAEFIESRPEIKWVSLVWMWDFWSIYEQGVLIFEEVGEEFDWEYTVVAPREEALEHLRYYDNWDFAVTSELEKYITDGKLSIVHHAESEFAGGRSLYEESRITEDNGILSLANVECTILRHVDEPVTDTERHFAMKWNN